MKNNLYVFFLFFIITESIDYSNVYLVEGLKVTIT